MSFSRHDLPASVKNVVEVAIEARVIDALGLAELVSELEENGSEDLSKDVITALVNYAFASRHCDGRPHAKVAKAADVYWQERYGTKARWRRPPALS